MTWGEAVRLVRILRADPASNLAAALEGWVHPVTREALVLLDIFDLEHAVNSKKTPKAHWMRPGTPAGNTRKHGDHAGRSSAQVLALLRPVTESEVGGA